MQKSVFRNLVFIVERQENYDIQGGRVSRNWDDHCTVPSYIMQCMRRKQF